MQFKNRKGQLIGTLCSDGAYRARKKGSKHTLLIMDAWGLDSKVFNKLKEEGCKELRFLDEDNGVVYSIEMDSFEEKAVEKEFDGKQMFVSKKYWWRGEKEKAYR